MSQPQPPPLFGTEGRPLNGLESRALRASLGLVNRHVADLVNGLGMAPEPIRYALALSWERGKGFPHAVCDLLNGLERAVDRLGEAWAQEFGPIRRPIGEAGAFAALAPHLHAAGVVVTPAQLAAIGQDTDLWSSLINAAVTRAALIARRAGAGPVAVLK